jgi:hypothetical protein
VVEEAQRHVVSVRGMLVVLVLAGRSNREMGFKDHSTCDQVVHTCSVESECMNRLDLSRMRKIR